MPTCLRIPPTCRSSRVEPVTHITTPSSAYRRLVLAVEAGRNITMPDRQLVLAARFALDCGFVTTARVALNELAERHEAAA